MAYGSMFPLAKPAFQLYRLYMKKFLCLFLSRERFARLLPKDTAMLYITPMQGVVAGLPPDTRFGKYMGPAWVCECVKE